MARLVGSNPVAFQLDDVQLVQGVRAFATQLVIILRIRMSAGDAISVRKDPR